MMDSDWIFSRLDQVRLDGDRSKRLSPADRFLLLDAVRRWCRAQREAFPRGGSDVPVRLRWGHGENSAGLSQEGYRIARRRLVRCGLLRRLRDGDKTRKDGRAKMLRDWFEIAINDGETTE